MIYSPEGNLYFLRRNLNSDRRNPAIPSVGFFRGLVEECFKAANIEALLRS